MKKIYFVGSIRDGREDASLYKQIIEYIQRSHKVLIEHIGNRSLSTASKGREADEKIYFQNIEWLRGYDLVTAECTSPSLGMGYELAHAERHHKPCFIPYDKSRTHPSAILMGNKYYHVFAYERPEEVFDILDKMLGNTPTDALSSNHRQTTWTLRTAMLTLLLTITAWILEIFNVYTVEPPIKSLVYVQYIWDKMHIFADSMINVPPLVQLKALVRIDGLWLAPLWTVSFMSMMHMPKSALGDLLMLATPPFMLWWFIKFRNYALDGAIFFARGLTYGCYCIFYAFLLFVLVQTVYFQSLDGGHSVQTTHQVLQTMEGVYQRNGVDIEQAMEIVDLMSALKPIELAFVFMTQNLLLGAFLSVIVAAIGTKRAKNHTRV